jgi:hypothetical protein
VCPSHFGVCLLSPLFFSDLFAQLTDLQLSPAPLTKVDVGFVFAIATAGAHVDVRAQMMAVDSFLLALQVASGTAVRRMHAIVAIGKLTVDGIHQAIRFLRAHTRKTNIGSIFHKF